MVCQRRSAQTRWQSTAIKKKDHNTLTILLALAYALDLAPFLGSAFAADLALALALAALLLTRVPFSGLCLASHFLGITGLTARASRSRLKTFTHQVYLILYPSSFFLPRHFIRYSKFKPSTALGDECNWSLYWWVVGRKHP